MLEGLEKLERLHTLAAENDAEIKAALREYAVTLSHVVAETREYGTEEQKSILRTMLETALAALRG